MTTTAPAVSVTVSSSVLANHLKAIAFSVEKNPIVPILENVLMRTSVGMMHLTTSNMNTFATTMLSAETDTKGDLHICVEFDRLLKLVSSLAEQPILIAQTENFGLMIKADSGNYQLPGENPVDWPKSPAFPSANTVRVRTTLLAPGLADVLPFVSGDELRPAMTGVNLVLNEKGMELAATNGHTLSTRQVLFDGGDVEGIEKELNIILPSKPLSAVSGLLSTVTDVEHFTEMIVDSKLSTLQFSLPNNLKVTVRLVDERYPDYKNAIPAASSQSCIVEKSTLMSALRRLDLFANKTTHQIRLEIDNSLSITAEDLDVSMQGKERVAADCERMNGPMLIGFDLKKLLLCLSVCRSKQVRIELTAPNRAAILRPAEAHEGDMDLQLIVPVMLNQYA